MIKYWGPQSVTGLPSSVGLEVTPSPPLSAGTVTGHICYTYSEDPTSQPTFLFLLHPRGEILGTGDHVFFPMVLKES